MYIELHTDSTENSISEWKGLSFRFRVLDGPYPFKRKQEARYGAPNELLELGKVTPGTYCTRQYDECYRKRCRLQSPNYPGMYPRNVTCYWTIKQKVVPTCKHAMVSISQENEHKALVKRTPTEVITGTTGRIPFATVFDQSPTLEKFAERPQENHLEELLKKILEKPSQEILEDPGDISYRNSPKGRLKKLKDKFLEKSSEELLPRKSPEEL
ncbi:hypothetical protein RP20_CCG006772 [Aedes albopictus]|nr:hypothetical protein RP20_CCG006772 [Aedes albopictus]